MDNIENKYLPIGTVVKIKENDLLFIIVGYGGHDVNNSEVMRDYIAYTYPEGFLTREENFLFNYESIEKVVSLGYKDEKYEEMIKKIKGEN